MSIIIVGVGSADFSGASMPFALPLLISAFHIVSGVQA
jgi:hypothetical protein